MFNPRIFGFETPNPLTLSIFLNIASNAHQQNRTSQQPQLSNVVYLLLRANFNTARQTLHRIVYIKKTRHQSQTSRQTRPQHQQYNMSENVLGVALTLSVVFVLHPLHRLPMRILQYHQETQPSCQFRNVKAKSWFCPVITRRPVSPELSLHSGLTHKEPRPGTTHP